MRAGWQQGADESTDSRPDKGSPHAIPDHAERPTIIMDPVHQADGGSRSGTHEKSNSAADVRPAVTRQWLRRRGARDGQTRIAPQSAGRETLSGR